MYKQNDLVILTTTVNSTFGDIPPLTKAKIINVFDDEKYHLSGELDGQFFNIVLNEHLFSIDKESMLVVSRKHKSKRYWLDDEVAIKSLKGKQGKVTGIGVDGKIAVRTVDMKENEISIYFEPSDLKILKRKYGKTILPFISENFQRVIYRKIFQKEFPVLIYDNYVMIDRSGFEDLLHDARYYSFLNN